MGWTRLFGKSDKKPDTKTTATPPARGSKGVKATTPLSGYGSNPYDTYTWELHSDPSGDRALKRAHRIDRRANEDEKEEKFNPYDTGRFNGGW